VITLHHLENSRSTRILWLLEELHLEYEVTRYKRDPKTMRAPASLRQVHPLGRSPLVSVDNQVLAESGAILEYFCEREQRLRPSDAETLQTWRYWLHYAEGSAMPPLLVKLIFLKLRGDAVPWLIRPIARGIADTVDKTFTNGELTAHFGWVEQWLSENEHFAGDFSAADIQMSYPVEASLSRAGLEERPATTAWLARMRARPAYAKALELGGPPIPGK
jgi:glutathione S-transferase